MLFKSVAKICGVLGIAACFTLNAASAEDLPLKGVKLGVGVSPTPPFIIVGESLENLSGIDVDIILELQRRTGFEIANGRLHLANFADLTEMGSKGELDIITGAFTISESRAKMFHQSVPTFRSHTVLVANTQNNIKTVNDLGNRTIANVAGASIPVELDPAVQSSIKVNDIASVFMTFYAVSNGEADAMMIDAPLALDAINSWANGKLRIADDIEGTDSDMGMMFKKDSQYSVILDDVLDQMRADGTVEKIIHKYLPGYVLPPELQPHNVALKRMTGASGTSMAVYNNNTSNNVGNNNQQVLN